MFKMGPFPNMRALSQQLRREKERGMHLNRLQFPDKSIGCLSQDVTITRPVPVLIVPNKRRAHKIKDPPEFILPDYPQDMPVTHPVSVPEIQGSCRTNEFILPNIKIEPIETENYLELKAQDATNGFLLPNIKTKLIEKDSEVYGSSSAEIVSGNFISSESENFCIDLDESSSAGSLSGSLVSSKNESSLISKYKLMECSVLLHDCLIPENFAAISARFKSIRVNTGISNTSHKVNSFISSETVFLPHISEDYKNLAIQAIYMKEQRKAKRESYKKRKAKKDKNKEVKRHAMAVAKKSKPIPKVQPNSRKWKISKSDKSSKTMQHSCNCFKAAEDSTVNMGNQYHESYSESAQQLCLCLINDNKLLEPTDILMKDPFLIDPDFGKINYGINRIEYDF